MWLYSLCIIAVCEGVREARDELGKHVLSPEGMAVSIAVEGAAMGFLVMSTIVNLSELVQ
jgi:hypothetical protein